MRNRLQAVLSSIALEKNEGQNKSSHKMVYFFLFPLAIFIFLGLLFSGLLAIWFFKKPSQGKRLLAGGCGSLVGFLLGNLAMALIDAIIVGLFYALGKVFHYDPQGNHPIIKVIVASSALFGIFIFPCIASIGGMIIGFFAALLWLKKKEHKPT